MKILRKLLLSIIALVSVATCFTVSTYAWFQVNSQAKVEGFDFQATGGLGFLMSTDTVEKKSYKNFLSANEMKAAMIYGYYEGTANEENYRIENGQLINNSLNKALTADEMNEILKNVLLSPVTSNDGVNFNTLSGGKIKDNDGKYVKFSIYFKATSNEASDNLSYDIYLCGDSISHKGDIVYGPNPEDIPGTHIITKNPDDVILTADMVVFDGTPSGKKLLAKDKITVHTSNATRLSIQEGQNKTATIYEITNEADLGSYATDYDSKKDVKDELDKLYNSNYNAMFTYYNNLRKYSQLSPMVYEEMPTTVRDLSKDTIMTTVKSGEEAKKLSFRFWLEGWDADCFDGLTQSINVRLLFNSNKPQKI